MRNHYRAFTFVLLAASLCFAPLARAADGNKILSDCKTYIAYKDKHYKGEVGLLMAGAISYCLGWVTGFVGSAETLPLVLTWKPDSPPIKNFSDITRETQKNTFFCMPSDSNTPDQWIRIVVSFFEKASPENLRDGPEVLALLAFRNAWPCKPTASKQ